MKYVIPAILCAFLVATFTFAQGTGTINQLDQWRRTAAGQITQNIASSTIKLTGYESAGDCLVTDSNGVVSTAACGTGSGTTTSTIYLATSSAWTVGQAAFVSGQGTVGSVATGTLTETVTGLQFNATNRGLLGGAAVLSLTSGYTIPTTNSLLSASASTTGNLAFWSGNQTIGNVATGTLTETVPGLELDATRSLVGGSAILALTSGYSVPSTTLITSASSFFASPSSLCTTITGSVDLCDGNDAASQWTTSGSDIYYSTGNVGIGSTTPASALGVTGTTTATGFRAMGVTASRALFTNATNDLVPTGASAALLNSLTDETGTGLAVFNTTPTFATSAISPIWQSTAADTADTGAVRLGNAEIIGWEASPAGTDVTLTVNTSETLVLAGGGFTATGGTATFGTLAGALDAGGATSFEIPNGANGTVDAIGEITLDTTDNQLVIATSTVAAAAAVIPTRQQIGAFLISSSSYPFTTGFVTGVAIPFKIQADGYTVTDIFCDIDGGTSIVINFDNGTGNTSTVTCDTDGASLQGVAAVGSNRVVAAGAVSTAIETGTVTGAPDYLRVSVFGLITRE